MLNLTAVAGDHLVPLETTLIDAALVTVQIMMTRYPMKIVRTAILPGGGRHQPEAMNEREGGLAAPGGRVGRTTGIEMKEIQDTTVAEVLTMALGEKGVSHS